MDIGFRLELELENVKIGFRPFFERLRNFFSQRQPSAPEFWPRAPCARRDASVCFAIFCFFQRPIAESIEAGSCSLPNPRIASFRAIRPHRPVGPTASPSQSHARVGIPWTSVRGWSQRLAIAIYVEALALDTKFFIVVRTAWSSVRE